jgi:phage shock protein A
MSLIQRISATFTSSVDRAVSRIENHDAIINAALKDTRRAAARSRVRLERVRRDGPALKSRYRELEGAAVRWADRARSIADEDETRALECLRRRRECLAQLENLKESIARHDELEQRIGEQVQTIEERIKEVTEQRNLMRSRQSVAEAMHAMNSVQGDSAIDIEDTFDRWEINLGETEILFGTTHTSDPLDTAFLQEEDKADLRAELEEMLERDKEDGS